MKKALSLLTALVLVALLALPAFAEDKSMTISTSSAQENWELSYPADTEIPWEAESCSIGTIQADKLQINPDKVLVVSVSSANGYKLVNDTDAQKTIAYTLVGADDIRFAPGVVGEKYDLSVVVEQAQWQQAAAGRHADQLTFVAETVTA